MPIFRKPASWQEPSDPDIDQVAEALIEGRLHPLLDGTAGEIWPVGEDSRVANDKLQYLLDYWRGKRRPGASVAHMADIDAIEMKGALGNVMLLDVLREGFDAKYRVYGTNISRHAGNDWTGWTVSDMNRKMQTPLAMMYRASYLAVFRTCRAYFTRNASPPWLDVKEWERLILPLVDDAGICRRFLVGNVPSGRRMPEDILPPPGSAKR